MTCSQFPNTTPETDIPSNNIFCHLYSFFVRVAEFYLKMSGSKETMEAKVLKSKEN